MPPVADPVAQAYALDLDGVCVDPMAYALTAVPERVWRAPGRIHVHAGLFGEHKLASVLPNIWSRREIERPHPNLQERFFAIAEDALISNVVGATRRLQNLLLLRLLGVPRERLRLIDEASDFAEDYRRILASLAPDGHIEQAVFSFQGERLLEAWLSRRRGRWEITRCSSPLLRAVLASGPRGSTLFVHLTSVYGSQIVPLIEVLCQQFGLHSLLLFGACGGLSPDLALHDSLFVRHVLAGDGRVIGEGNRLLPLAARLPRGLTGLHRSHVLDVASAPCILSETRPELERLARYGAAAVDLELGPLAACLARHPSLQWGAVLRVSDLPLVASQRLGTVRLLGENTRARQREIRWQASFLGTPVRRAPGAVRRRSDGPW